jgi:hypothetical protein
MRVELGFDNSLCPVDVERLELRITGFTEADCGNVLRYDPEITFWHEHRLCGSRQTDRSIQAGSRESRRVRQQGHPVTRPLYRRRNHRLCSGTHPIRRASG